ncbi:pentatricopeptide repeat-containing protein At4g30700 [Salvia hispanica]|uniref:pentatricopeptide repeat-containing protein At4g30700 n=1 Tax=Salvia hispanica TaxID=49212 RepID=UPI002009BA61|nr:pentatricopeptide repeat-containing protein At4g30700 [Salvia hispanica]
MNNATPMALRAIANPGDRNRLLNLINQSITISHLNQTHAQIIHNGHLRDNFIVTKLIQKLLDFKAQAQAKLLFANIDSPDLFLYNVLIKGLRHAPFDSLSVYNTLLRKTELKPDNFTYSFVISAFSSFSSSVYEKLTVLLHGHAVVSGFGSDAFVGSALVDAYTKFSKIRIARNVFDEISQPDTVLWNTLLSGLVKNSCFDESLGVFRDMISKAARLDSTTLAVALSAVAELQRLRDGMMVQALSIKVGCHFDKHVLTCLVSLYSKCGCVSTARLLFELIRRPDLVAYNAMISGFSCNGEAEKSLQLFQQLLSSENRVSSSSLVGLIPVFHPFGHLDLIRTIHGFGVKSGFASNSSVSTALTTVYSRLNELELARGLFDELPEKPLASWNAMISGYAQNGATEKAIPLFQEMQELDIRPNPVTITTILSACAQLGALGLGKWLHRLIKKESLLPSIYISTALIDMYMKCGSIEEARRLFDAMDERNAVTWNAMISGYGLHGEGKEALRLYREMQEAGVPPTGVTHLSVLYACSHSGLVEEGERVFHSMIHVHGFEPKSEHYACMVDILGRGGQLEEAVEFITKKMHFAPGPAQWGALLGACMVHKDTKLARLASARLFELDPGNIGYHVLLSNIHSTNSNFSEAASTRQVVRRKGKTPGCTLIEVKGRAHVFTSGDRSHPQSGEIYAALEQVMGKMKDEGYVAETVMALHDVEEEEKEMMVKVHSEKLAIAFGLMMCEDGDDEIRIIKNLRVCLDCHTFTKYVSKISGRKITVRDANRFHHFQHGECSCRDYW